MVTPVSNFYRPHPYGPKGGSFQAAEAVQLLDISRNVPLYRSKMFHEMFHEFALGSRFKSGRVRLSESISIEYLLFSEYRPSKPYALHPLYLENHARAEALATAQKALARAERAESTAAAERAELERVESEVKRLPDTSRSSEPGMKRPSWADNSKR